MGKRSHRRIRDLDVLAASQGLVANEIGCARISMMAGEQNTPFNGPNTDARDQSSPDRHIRLAPHGRSIQKYMGDGVLIYFGYPQAHEDDAERAVRAGLELVVAVSDRRQARARRQGNIGRPMTLSFVQSKVVTLSALFAEYLYKIAHTEQSVGKWITSTTADVTGKKGGTVRYLPVRGRRQCEFATF